MKLFKSGDEYVDKKRNQFCYEAGIITAALLFLDVLIRGVILDREPSEYAVSGGVFALYVCLILFRYLMSGLEYPDIFTKQTYSKKRREIFARSMASGAIFLVLAAVFTGIPREAEGWLDLVVMCFLFVLFYFLMNAASLYMSFKKNKDLLDK
ncbi:hypothetical protein MOC05_10540 [Bacillus sonorensis]|uniref:DUF6773 family protein n=1 Tax=Bacillus sonorensis TaxID=119858 RepID=UPI00227EADAC|nr:DUF6773 family protein [Bacillus sonorensis]MCY8025585.1 hypothetical protein [Bacillus sonorensis]